MPSFVSVAEKLPTGFLSFKVKGSITELTQKELAFTREEIVGILGFDDPAIYDSTEGWLWPSVLSRFCWRTVYPLATLLPTAMELCMPTFSVNASQILNSDMVDFLKNPPVLTYWMRGCWMMS